MPPEINALLDKPWLLFIILAIGAACGMGVERFAESMKRAERRAYWKGRNWRGGKGPTLDTIRLAEAKQDAAASTAADQLKTVMKAQFKSRALLNKPERRLLGHIDKALADHSPGWRAMGQVSLGEILYSPDKDAYWAVNAKRVDLLIIDADCRPLHAVEFQGSGHHVSGEAAARDAVKKEALRRAGIGYVEVVTGDTPADVREMVRKLVGRAVG
jgi:hypothetical protein